MLSITGMTCEHCEKAVKEAISKTGAMVEAISHKNGNAAVCFNPQQIKDEAIVNSINSINQTEKYKVTGCKEC